MGKICIFIVIIFFISKCNRIFWANYSQKEIIGTWASENKKNKIVFTNDSCYFINVDWTLVFQEEKYLENRINILEAIESTRTRDTNFVVNACTWDYITGENVIYIRFNKNFSGILIIEERARTEISICHSLSKSEYYKFLKE